jgi:hypothetical protein
LDRARFPEDYDVVDAMRRAKELAGQQLAGATAFVAEREATSHAKEEKVLDAARVVMNALLRTMVRSRQVEEEAWALAAAIATAFMAARKDTAR